MTTTKSNAARDSHNSALVCNLNRQASARICRLRQRFAGVPQFHPKTRKPDRPAFGRAFIYLFLLYFLERARRFERPTPTLARLCSTPELRPHPWGGGGV